MRNNNFTGNRVDTGTLPRIGGSRRDTETWKFKIIDWFKREGITTNENKYSYIITAVEDDIVRILMEKEKEVNRALTLDECVKLIKKKYWRENLKEDKLSQLKKIIITPNENVCDFNTRFLELYDQLDFNDKSYISVIDYENALRPRGRIYEMVAMADVDNLEDACRLAEKFESIINKSRVGNEIWGSYTTNIKNNYNGVINYGQIERSNYKNNFSDKYNKNASNIWIVNNIRNHRNFRNYPINIVTQGIQNNNLNKYTKPRQNTYNYYRFSVDNDNNSNLNVSNDNNISYHYRNRKILKSNLKISSSNSSTNNNKVNSNNDKNNSNINNVNENIINNNSINNIINNGISNLDTNNTNNNNNNNNYNNDNDNNDDIYNNKNNNYKNNTLNNIVNVEQNKLYAFKMDIFRKKNYKIGNTNNGKFETNSNIIITKEENKNSFAGNTDIKKNQNNNMEINSIVTINIKTIDNNENINI